MQDKSMMHQIHDVTGTGNSVKIFGFIWKIAFSAEGEMSESGFLQLSMKQTADQ